MNSTHVDAIELIAVHHIKEKEIKLNQRLQIEMFLQRMFAFYGQGDQKTTPNIAENFLRIVPTSM